MTSKNDSEALNFGFESHLSHDQRYDRGLRRQVQGIDSSKLPDAGHYSVMELIFRLWDSWEDGALLLDRAGGIYADVAGVHYVNYTACTFAMSACDAFSVVFRALLSRDVTVKSPPSRT